MVTLMVMMMVIIVTPTVQAVFKKQIDVFVEEGLDFVLCEVSSDQRCGYHSYKGAAAAAVSL